MPRPIIVDGHEDIAWNKVALRRDFTVSVVDKRRTEGQRPEHGEGSATVGLPELIAGNIRVVFATLYVAPPSPERKGEGRWGRTYATPQEAHDQAREQVAYYDSLAADPRVRIVRNRADLERVVASLDPQVGLVILMEGADPIVEPSQAQEWFDAGVRIVGLSWERTRYAGGTGAPGGLTELGRALLREMEVTGLILDMSHMAEQSFFEALDVYHGPAMASHANCRAFVNTDRQLSDEMIRGLAARDGVIGLVFYNRFIKPDWDKGALKNAVGLSDVVHHARHICDLTGSAGNVGIGSDFDGGFGLESTPREIDTVADLSRLGDALTPFFDDEQILDLLGRNWIRLLRRSLPG